MRRFDDSHPKSARDIYNELYEDRAKILLGATTSLADFLTALQTERKLKLCDGGYVITVNGISERKRLGQLINSAS
jgi:hypothetical protein